MRVRSATFLLTGFVLAMAPDVADACLVGTNDYCILCEWTSKKEADYCPGGDLGLIILQGQNQGCAVSYYDPNKCVNAAGVVNSVTPAPSGPAPNKPALSVTKKGGRTTIEMSDEQFDAFVNSLRKQLK